MADVLDQGSSDKLGVFISYSRDDLAFADQLVATLDLAGFAPTIDRVGIHGAEAWEDKLRTLIREADTVVFVLSPASAASKVCAWEVAEAVAMGKRIIPIIARPLDGATPPPALAKLNYIFFYAEPTASGSGWAAGLRELDRTLKTDLVWLSEHTRLFKRATEWDTGGRSPIRMLSGADILEARAWAARQPREAPAPTPLHLAFIEASQTYETEQTAARERDLAERERIVRAAEQDRAAREAAQAEALASADRERRQAVKTAQRTFAGLVVASVLAIAAGGAGYWALQERDRAEEQTRQAVANLKLAEAQKARADASVAAGTRVANGLIFNIVQKFKDLQGVPQTLVRDLLVQAQALTDELAKGGEAPPDLLHSRAAALDELAGAYQRLGDTVTALAAARSSAAILEKLAAAHPERPDWQRDVSVSLERIADVLKDAGDATGALDNYRKSLVIREKLAAAHPERILFQTDLVVSCFKLATIGVDVRENLSKARNIVRGLAERGMLTAAQQRWPAILEQELAQLDQPADPAAAVRAAITAAAEAGRHDEALRLQAALAAQIEAGETAAGGKLGEATASALGSLAWHALFAREPAQALAAADRALAIAPEELWIETNRAHALMFLNQAEEARAAYLARKDKPIPSNDNKPWQQVIGEDFAEFRKAGRAHPQMAEIEAALGTAAKE